MSSVQFSEWLAYFGIEHLGESPEWRADVRQAVSTAALVNLQVKQRVTPEDLMPRFQDEADAANEAALLASFRAKAAKAKPKGPDVHPSTSAS